MNDKQSKQDVISGKDEGKPSIFMVFHACEEQPIIAGRYAIEFHTQVSANSLQHALEQVNNNPDVNDIHSRLTTIGDIIHGNYNGIEGFYKVVGEGFELICLDNDHPE